MLRKKKRHRLINFICLLAVYKKIDRSSIGVGIASMTSQNGGQDGRSKMAAMTSRSRWV